MEEQSLRWTSFWDLASPERAARVLVAMYGTDATLAAAHCALAARTDERREDARFWHAVFRRLRAGEQAQAEQIQDARDLPALSASDR